MKTENTAVVETIAIVALAMVAIGALFPLFNMGQMADWAKYLFAAGACVLLVARLMAPYRGDNLRLKRLTRMQLWSALCFCVGAFFMYYEPQSARDWLAFTLAGAVLQGYASFMISYLARK